MTLARSRTSHGILEIPARGAPVDPLLTYLRDVGRRARCKARTDLFRACESLSGNPDVAAEACCEVLMRCLAQTLGRRPVLFQPGESEMSFDEAWLVRLAQCLEANDAASVHFLIRSRVPVHARRNVRFLLNSVVEAFSKDLE